MQINKQAQLKHLQHGWTAPQSLQNALKCQMQDVLHKCEEALKEQWQRVTVFEAVKSEKLHRAKGHNTVCLLG